MYDAGQILEGPLMSAILAPVTDAINIELVDEASEESHVLLDILSDDGGQARIRVRREQMHRLASAFSDRAQLRPSSTSSFKAPSAYVLIAATSADLLIDSTRETAALTLDPGNGLKCMVPLSAELAHHLAAIGRAATRYLQSLSRVKVVH